MTGKMKCMVLRELRRKIADENGIPFETEECDFEGDCPGTCPKCEEELRYLEERIPDCPVPKRSDPAEVPKTLDRIIADMNRQTEEFRRALHEEDGDDTDPVPAAVTKNVTTGVLRLDDEFPPYRKKRRKRR